jgi:ABC-type transport system involved in cytochrome c biogenesis permease component
LLTLLYLRRTGLLISLLILIPVVVFGANALSSVNTVAGLESKMTGTVGIDSGKA